MASPDIKRRTVVKRGAQYVAPAIITLLAAPAFAKSGSDKPSVGKPDNGGRSSDARRARRR